jgi:hypothetical protein
VTARIDGQSQPTTIGQFGSGAIPRMPSLPASMQEQDEGIAKITSKVADERQPVSTFELLSR